MPVLTEQFTNFASSNVAGGAGGAGTLLGAADTSLLLSTGDGAKFPATANGTWKLLLGDPLGSNEIVLVTVRATDTLTITRAQESTTAQTWAYGTPVQAVVTAASWQTIYNRITAAPYFNVRDYGAKGDGSTDDTTAIAAAITAASAAGGIVYLPASTYIVSSTLTVAANCILKGDGPGGTTIKTSSATADILLLNGTTSGVCDLHLASTPTRTAGAGVNIGPSAYYYYVDGVLMDGMFDGIHIGNGTLIPNTIWITNTTIHNSVHASIYLQSGQNIYATNVVIWHDTAASTTTGFLWTAQNSVYMTQVTVFQAGQGFVIQPVGANTVGYGWFANCSADTCATRGWLLDASNNASAIVQEIGLYNCWGSTSGTNDGFLAQAGVGTVRNIFLDGFQSYSNGTNGIAFFAGCTQFDVHGCRVGGNSRVVNNTNSGIYVAGGCTHFSLTSNRSGFVAGFAATQNAGILLDTGASTNFIVAMNDATGNVTSNIVDNSTAVLSKHIWGNMGFNPAGSITAPAFPATTVAATNGTGFDATAYIANGTSAITVIQVAGQSNGAYVTTGMQIAASGWGSVRIPAGGGVKFTYAGGVPTWTWMGE